MYISLFDLFCAILMAVPVIGVWFAIRSSQRQWDKS